MRLKTSASVTLTVEVQAHGAYGLDWVLDDLRKAVSREVESSIRGKLPGVVFHGDPKVKICTFEVE